MAGWLSYGECDILPTPYSSAPNEPIKMAFGTRDYVMETTPPANFYPITLIALPHGMGSWNGVKYNDFCPSLFCLFFLVITGRRHQSAEFHDLGVK